MNLGNRITTDAQAAKAEAKLVEEVKREVLQRLEGFAGPDPGMTDDRLSWALGFAESEIRRDLAAAEARALRDIFAYSRVDGDLLDSVVRHRDRLLAIRYLREKAKTFAW